MTERIILFNGPDKDFKAFLDKQINPNEETIEFLETVRLYNARIRASDSTTPGFDVSAMISVDNCIVRAYDFASVTAHVISNFAAIVTQAHDIDNLYIQNPPKRVIDSLESMYPGIVEYEFSSRKEVLKSDLGTVYASLKKTILGQEDSKREIISALYRLITMQSLKPSVLLFYGPSGVGKTESVRCLSEALGGKLTRVQMSMMQDTEAFEYIFGAEHSKGSFARDLLGRESDVVLLDEFDKVPVGLYNAFYQVFDEGMFVDTNYEVDVKNVIFICTSNFSNEEEVKKILGPAMYSRIGACIEFYDLPDDEKREIAAAHYSYIFDCLDDDDKTFINNTDIANWFQKNAPRYDNVRIMKTKIERAIFGQLTTNVLKANQ